MRLRLRTKFTLVMTSLVLFVVAVLSYVFAAQLLEQLIQETDKRAADLSEQVFLQAKHALIEAAQLGLRPDSYAPEEIHDYVRHAFEISEGLRTQFVAAKKNPLIYEVSITDTDDLVLASTDENLQGKFLPHRASLSQLVGRSFLHQIKVLLVPTRRTVKNPQLFEHGYSFINDNKPFGEVRVIVDSALLVQSIQEGLRTGGIIVLVALVVSALLAALVTGITLAPLRDITVQLDRISAGQFDALHPGAQTLEASGDEFGLMSRKISQVGQQLRGVHEIFSTMRENMNSVMAGLEDGLLLFTRDARAVMVSPAAEKFLGAPASEFLGRRVTDIFPPGHPLRDALHIESEELSEITAEADLETSDGPKRVNVSVQAIQEAGERMGALVTLRDLDSLESIGTQLRVSERLAALGRITAGVAHEVKNPLNSMRLWLENLKESLSDDGDGASQQAVQVLDKEIDRLDAVVKRFLDFTRPMELKLEATDLAELLREVMRVAHPQLLKAGVEVEELLGNGIPEVWADRDLLKQAVLNLVLNAAEAMTSGGELRVELGRRGEMAEISVSDTGKGIPTENQQKIFQLFFTTRPGGSGIGLATTFRIVQLHNGSIDFQSEAGRGTTFRIELPLAA